MSRMLRPFRTPNDVFAGFDNMINKLFSESFGDEFNMKWSGYPRLDLYDDDSNLTIEAAVPGLTKDNVNVEWSNGILTIRGESSNNQTRDVQGYKHKELHRSKFARSLSLDERDYDVTAVSAEVKDGLLTVKVPKRAQLKHEVKKIEVN